MQARPGSLDSPPNYSCVNHVQLDLDCGISFVGKNVVEFVAKDCKHSMTDEHDYISNRLEQG